MHILLAEGNHLVDDLSELLCLRIGRLDSFVVEQGGRHISEHRLPVTGVSTQLPSCFLMSSVRPDKKVIISSVG